MDQLSKMAKSKNYHSSSSEYSGEGEDQSENSSNYPEDRNKKLISKGKIK